IHFNPVEAGLARKPEGWPWSSYRQFIGSCPGIADIDWPLSLFGGRTDRFVRFVLQRDTAPGSLEPMEDSRADTAAGRARRTAPAVDGRFDRLALDVSKEFGLPLRALFHNEPFIDVRVARRRLAARAAGAGIRT